MHRLLSAVIAVGLLGLVAGLTLSHPDTDGAHSSPVLQEQRTFEGVARCKTCHRKPEQGEQFRIWEESAHSEAYATLACEKAKEVAAEMGIENPQQAEECLTCHVTAHGVAEEYLGRRYDIADGVGCESCHGAGGDYYKKTTMEAIYAGELEGESVGLITPTEEVCVQCHNEESPTFKGFDFEEYVEKIAHPIPEGGSGESGEEEDEDKG